VEVKWWREMTLNVECVREKKKRRERSPAKEKKKKKKAKRGRDKLSV
jgi:hypothetical protein